MAGRSTDVSSGFEARAITPSDSVSLPNGVCRGLYVGVTGDVTALMAGGSTVLFKGVPVGILPIQCVRVNLTATTATNILALY